MKLFDKQKRKILQSFFFEERGWGLLPVGGLVFQFLPIRLQYRLFQNLAHSRGYRMGNVLMAAIPAPARGHRDKKAR